MEREGFVEELGGEGGYPEVGEPDRDVLLLRPAAGFDGSRGWISNFQDRDGPLGARDVAETLIAGGVEHHLALVPGHVAGALRTAAGWLGARAFPRIDYREDPAFVEVEP